MSDAGVMSDPVRSDAVYRPDIDGLRGLSVTAVVLFHLGLDAVPGGFVGVDVFFVISGFLITKNIVADAGAGTFRFSGFYARRARRLFPALFFTLFSVFVAGVLLLPVNQQQLIAESVVYALGSVSNFLFWREAGYFSASHARPLLHTWSLSVEEQFYLVWPCILIVLLRVGRAWAVWLFLVVSGALSLVAAQHWALFDSEATFYLAPFRVFEFAVGAACVWLAEHRPKNALLLEPLAGMGFVALVVPILSFGEEASVDVLPLLWPCAGAALLIYAGTAKYLGVLLRNRVAVGLGLISYSLYLAHWPLIVFYRFYRMVPLTMLDDVALVGASVSIGALMYRFVEQPFRTVAPTARLRPAAFGLNCVGLVLLLGAPAAWVWQDRDWALRRPPEVIARGSWDLWSLAVREGVCHLKFQSGTFEDVLAHRNTCLSPRQNQANFLVSGDSHGADFYASLRAAYPTASLLQATGPGCRPIERMSKDPNDRCGRMLNFVKHRFDKARSIDGVVLAARWNHHDRLAAITSEIDYYEQRGIPVVVVGPGPEFEPGVPRIVWRFGRVEGLEDFAYKFRVQERAVLGAKIRALAESRHVPYIDLIDVFCDGARCKIFDQDHRALFLDYGHWSIAGHSYVGRRLAEKYPTLQNLFKVAN